MITIGQLRAHCRADVEDDTLLGVYLDAAVKACARAANRNLYWTQDELTAARETAVSSLNQAEATYKDTIAVNKALYVGDTLFRTNALAGRQWDDAVRNYENIVNGRVIEGDIIEAILMTAGHYYRNREEVTASNGAQAVQLPQSAEIIMYRNRYIGEPM